MKPSKEDIAYAKSVNDRLIQTQTYDPKEIREAYRRLFGEEAPNQHFARSKVFTYFQYIYKAVDETQTAEINTQAIVIDNPSHSEDIDDKPIETNLALDESIGKINKPKRQRKPKK